MTDHIILAQRYLDAWNETDPAARRRMIGQTWTDGGDYRDPQAHSTGHAAIDALIAGVQAKFPGFRFRLTGKVDSYADRVRFRWALIPQGEERGTSGGAEPVAEGTDFAVVAADGRFATVTGFIDRMPTA
jgi:hypothetical protein